jgi:ABC-2 type transport system ATP-binding protein
MIEAHGLERIYGQVQAVGDVSFAVKQGEVVGLLGPNGAGKTTIMKILATQIVPTAGRATVAGVDVVDHAARVRSLLGYLPEKNPLYEDMEVREYLSFVGEGRHVYGARLKERLGWVAAACGLAEVWCRPIDELSKGYRQRVGLAQALIHDPPVLILDEPTSGLDPLQIIEIRSLIRNLAEQKAILFSTHILQEIAAVSDRALVLNDGQLIADGELADLASQTRDAEVLRVAVEGFADQKDVLAGLPDVLEVQALSGDDALYHYRVTGRAGMDLRASVARLAREEGWGVHELYREEADLEEVFTALIRSQRQPKS